MMQFRLFGFPVSVQPFFLITAFLIGPRGSVPQIVTWILMVFAGVLAHELGHAVTARHFGLQPSITLHAFGGMTAWRNDRSLSHRRQILLSAAGPAVGIVVGVTLLLSSNIWAAAGPAVKLAVDYGIWINLGWGLVNLAPILPLDGGQIAASAAEGLFGRRGRTAATVLSLAATAILALWSVWNGEIWLSILAVILAISNLQSVGWLRSRTVERPREKPSDAVRSYDLARRLARAGEEDQALEWLDVAIRSGFSNADAVDADPAWSSLRNHPHFVELRRSL